MPIDPLETGAKFQYGMPHGLRNTQVCLMSCFNCLAFASLLSRGTKIQQTSNAGVYTRLCTRREQGEDSLPSLSSEGCRFLSASGKCHPFTKSNTIHITTSVQSEHFIIFDLIRPILIVLFGDKRWALIMYCKLTHSRATIAI